MKTKNKERRQAIELTELTIAELYHLRNSVDADKDAEIVQDLKVFEENLNTHYLAKGKGYAVGRKEVENEKSTKYFFQRPIIPGSKGMLYNEFNEEVTNDKERLQICSQFCEKLYTDSQPVEMPYYNFVPSEDYDRKLTEQQKEILDQEVGKDEMYTTLKYMKLGKAPGIDGMMVEFYLEFWDIVGDLLYESFNYAKSVGQFSISQRR